MPRPSKSTVEVSLTYKSHHLTVCGYFTAGSPGRYSGPPEDCYPGEASEFEIETIEWVDDDGRSHEQVLELLTDRALDDIADAAAAEYETSLREQAEEEDYDDWAESRNLRGTEL